MTKDVLLPPTRTSLNLIKGTLDQVDEKAQITWVQPRVLSRAQIGSLGERLDRWSTSLSDVEQFAQNQTGEASAA